MGFRPRLTDIRWKLFFLISTTVALPVAVLVPYLSSTGLSLLEDALGGKARTLTDLLTAQLRPAIAFDDVLTAREAFDSALTDEDVTYVAVVRGNGRVLHARGEPDASMPLLTPPRAAGLRREIMQSDDALRVIAPIVSDEGPRGALVLELSKSRVTAAGRQSTRTAMSIGLGVLVAGLVVAWLVGSSMAARIHRVKVRADSLAAGDLSEAPLSDESTDEIGQMARAFQTMVSTFERKVEERTDALARSREQFRRLLESTNAIPWQVDTAEGRIVYLGPQASVTLGTSLERLHDPSYLRARVPGHELARARAVLAHTMQTGEDGEVEFTFVRDDGRRVMIRSLMSLGGGDARGSSSVVGFMLDVTRERQLEVDLRQAQKLESVGRLAAGVAHEINTPIQFVSDSVTFVHDVARDGVAMLERYRGLHGAMRAHGLEAEVAALEATWEEADLDYGLAETPRGIDRALEGLGRVAAIVRAMKAFAHPEAHTKAPADIDEALRATLVIASSEYKYVADIVTDFGSPPPVTCHIGELNQAFLNIIVNAAHAIADRVGTSGARGMITVSTRCEAGAVVVRIQDTGGGIPPEVRGRIFDPFFTTKQVGRGTGQGLTIARNVVVEKHGGTLELQTEMGVGTTFEIWLPLPRDERAPVVARAA